jgi:short-subunit dehydrogenase
MRATPQQFHERVVIVTGASGGLGLAIAKAFAAAGARVAMVARNVPQLQAQAANLRAATRAEVEALACDVTDAAQVTVLIGQVVARFGRIDILVNNAGQGMIAPFEFVQLPDAEALFDVVFWGALRCTQAVLPYMQQQHQGQIVNVASVGGLRGVPNIGIYSAAKSALIAFSDSLRIEAQDCGISVTVVCPGRITGTQFFDRATRYGPLKLYEVLPPLSAEVVANAVLAATARRQRLLILPRQARVWHWLNHLFPRLTDAMLYKNMPRLERG